MPLIDSGRKRMIVSGSGRKATMKDNSSRSYLCNTITAATKPSMLTSGGEPQRHAAITNDKLPSDEISSSTKEVTGLNYAPGTLTLR